jgi:HK97 family phage portal protein
MRFMGKNFFAPAKKASAAASIMVQYLVGRPQHERRSYERASREAYIQNVIVNRCVCMIATAAASVDLDVFSGKTEDTREELEDHPLVTLLERPNPRYGDDAFFRALYSMYLIGGEVFVERVSSAAQIKELWLHRPDRIVVTPGETGLPASYAYKNGVSQKVFPCDLITGESDILHLRDFNPIDDWRGLSSCDPASYSIDIHNEGSAWNFGLLKNGARPSGALMVKSNESNRAATLTDQQFKRLKEEIYESMAGGQNAGRPIVLEGDMDWKEFSLNPKDMDFQNSNFEACRNIARAFGVPPILLGIPGDSTYNNLREAKLAFWEDTVLPLVNFVIAELNHWLAPKFGANIYIDVCEESISALSLRRDERRKSLQIADFLTINEKRAEDGKEPIEGGDVLLVDSVKVPLQMAGMAQQQLAGSSGATQDETPDASMSKGQYVEFLIKKQGFPGAQAKRIAEIVYGV